MTELIDAYAMARENPDGMLTCTIPVLTVGFRARRVVRALLADAEFAGADVTAREQKGLLGSVFTLRAEGTGRQLHRMLAGFCALESYAREGSDA